MPLPNLITQILANQLSEITSIVISPDGNKLASASALGIGQLWDIKTASSVWVFEQNRLPIYCTAFSFDGFLLASGSWSTTVKVWDIRSRYRYSLKGHSDSVLSVAFSPTENLLASASIDRTIKVWIPYENLPRYTLEGHTDAVTCIEFSPNGMYLASGSRDNSIKLWTQNHHIQTFNGHGESISSIKFSSDGRFLISSSIDQTVKIWDVQKLRLVHTLEGHNTPIKMAYLMPDNNKVISVSIDGTVIVWSIKDSIFQELHSKSELGWSPIAFTNSKYAPMLLGNDIQIKHIDIDIPEKKTPVASRYTSAKVLLVGESEVGKSSLVWRLNKGEYREHGSTHGLRRWKTSLSQLDPHASIPPEEERDITFWDLGGQEEYRLIHQLFFHDTTLALLLFSPDRGEKSLADIREWGLRLEKGKRGLFIPKLLVGTKADLVTQDMIDHNRINNLIKELKLESEWILVSAKDSTNINQLKSYISNAIDWEALSVTTRPILYQNIQNSILARQQADDVVVLYSDLETQIAELETLRGKQFDPKAVKTVVDQLERQGVIVDTYLSSGERALVVQIEYIEIYGGSLILLAKKNSRGAPAIELSEIYSMKAYPGINNEDRLHPFQERVVIECVVQLLLYHGVCLRHEGLLIFPSLFPTIDLEDLINKADIVSIYYDFSGAIDNIYSSLVVSLAHSERFGRVRLSSNHADYDQCGLRKVDRQSGFAHLDLLFSTDCSQDTRDLFINLVEDHLQREGVEIKEVLEIVCPCNYKFEETLIRKRIEDHKSDVICPDCESRHTISEGAMKSRIRNPNIEQEMFALKTELEKKSIKEASEVKIELAASPSDSSANLRVLHLSDLHFGLEDNCVVRLQQLSSDLKDKIDGLGFDTLDYLVISGDLTNCASKEEFDNAYEFISGVIERFRLSAERCIIVPGNHDLSWDQDVYDWKQERLIDPKELKTGRFVKEGKMYGLRDEAKYPARFDNFSKFYHSLIQLPYPLQPEVQGVPFLYDEPRLQFLTMNSAWEIDEWHKERSGIHDKALAKMLTKADEQIQTAKKSGRLHEDANVLRLAVWHHPVTGNEKIAQDAFLEQLRKADVKLCLHGHVHEDRADLVGYLHPTRKLHIVGAGSFGAGAKERPPAIPRLYNVVEIWRDHSKIRVHTRCLKKDGGAWEGWAVWPGPDNHTKRSFYEIELR